MKFQVIIFIVSIFFIEVYCEEIKIKNENDPLKKDQENFNSSPLVDSKLLKNPFSSKGKRCIKSRFGPLVGSSQNTLDSTDEKKNNKLYDTLCKTCVIRHNCENKNCPLCEKWCTKQCQEMEEPTKGVDEAKGDPPILGSRGNFGDDDDKSKDYTIILNRGNLLEIILGLLGVYDHKNVESMTITVRSKGGDPIILNNFDKSDETSGKLAEKVADLKNALSQRMDHDKFDKLLSEILSKLQETPSDTNPKVSSRFIEPQPNKNTIHQSANNPDIIEDTLDMSKMKDLLGNPTQNQEITKSSPGKNYEPLNSKDFINVGRASDPSDFEEEALQQPKTGAVSSRMPSLEKIETKPHEIMDRLQSQRFQKSGFNDEIKLGQQQYYQPIDNGARTPVHHHHSHHSHSDHPKFLHHHHRSNEPINYNSPSQPFDKVGEPNNQLHSQFFNNPVGQPNPKLTSHLSDSFVGQSSQPFDNPVEQTNNQFNSRLGSQLYDTFVGETFNHKIPSQAFDNPEDFNKPFVNSQPFDNPVGQSNNQLNSRLASQHFNNPLINSQPFDNPVGQSNNQLNSRLASQHFNNPLINSKMPSQPLNNPVGQTHNQLNSRLASQHSNNPLINSQPFDNPVGQSNNQLNSKLASQHFNNPLINSKMSSQQFENPVGQTNNQLNTRLASQHFNNPLINSKMPSQQFENPVGQLNSRLASEHPLINSKIPSQEFDNPVGQINSRLVSQYFDNPVGQPNNYRMHSQQSDDHVGQLNKQFSSRLASKRLDNPIELSDPKIPSQSLNNPVGQSRQSINKDNNHFVDEVETPSLDSHKNTDPEVAASVQDSDKSDTASIKNSLNARTTELIKRFKDQMEKSRSNAKKFPEEAKSLGKMLENSKTTLQDKPKDIVSSQPLENSFERIQPDNVPIRRPWHNQGFRKSLPKEDVLGMLVNNRGGFDTISSSNSLGRIIPGDEKMDISFKKPTDIFFIGKGIKLPLQMETKDDGAVHFSVDIDKLCSCNKTSCPRNHTKELEKTMETILEKEAELKDQLSDFEDSSVGAAKFVDLKDRISQKFSSSGEGNIFKRSIGEEKTKLKKLIEKTWKDLKTNTKNQTDNILEFKTFEDNVIPISKRYKFKGLEDELAKKMENIEKTVDNYSKIDDKIFENESKVLNEFNEDPIIRKEIGLVTKFLSFFKKLAVDGTKHKNK